MHTQYKKSAYFGLGLLFCIFINIPLVSAQTAVTPAVKAARSIVTNPDQAQQLLLTGNKRFMNNSGQTPDISPAKRVDLLNNGQTPFAIIVSCSDSRVSPEHVFDQGLGDLFVVRAAGNVLDSIGTGSVEFAVKVLETPLIVVMGHDECGAVHAAVDGGNVTPNINSIIKAIQPAVKTVRTNARRNAPNSELYEIATDANVQKVVAQLKANENFKGRLANKQLKIVGAKYNQNNGEVRFFE